MFKYELKIALETNFPISLSEVSPNPVWCVYLYEKLYKLINFLVASPFRNRQIASSLCGPIVTAKLYLISYTALTPCRSYKH